MILAVLISVLFVGGVLAWLSENLDPSFPKVVALTTMLISVAIMLTLLGESDSEWVASLNAQWIPRFGISFHLAADGLSTLLILLTGFLGVIAIGAAWDEINDRSGFFYFNLLWTLAGVVGVFTALDLFLFFFFWEVMLIPMYFMIAIWGHENKNYAAMKFFIFTQVTGMLMLISILMLAYFHYIQFGWLSFDYFDLLNVSTSGTVSMWMMLGFFAAFATKLPSMPFHSWLPDAHSQAPTAGSVILAGVLLKTGAYGLIRFAVPLFPEASMQFAPVAMTLAVLSILYCAKVAFAQTDIKRLIAYTSVSHMGFVMLGIYAWNEQALQGAVMTMLAHGLSAAALFMLAGGLQHRIHTRDMTHMGGFWAKVPRMSFAVLFFSIAALGMPGLGNFVGEFLALLGAFQASIPLTVAAAFGLIFASVYSLWVIQKVFHGEYRNSDFDDSHLSDLSRREMVYVASMMFGLVWMGMYPQSFLDMSEATIQGLLTATESITSMAQN
ncbi:MAG: NADH-quinone oxidoreductase subunit M [Gammaproteobacteria bacterium]|jgi:NADH-quinone oxidoreductase subunit M|nr:NADH-quinone oxidoreductase subunit M [Gammaproteobacteria bacterium]MBT3858722.1 NADH-quinone oxidoreductase subunit M [Gammaproteobacteria bacterium]MBT3986074.1 NADH-quinone oxidoreductase subunit M [Gammaproteobacteria bacterium]MBT4255492.1 NADH-quinone oxidoreductase subunit M [Gammaproteobacteria bacterium]MBT4580785.1 NADH-quinone oxidoreductase subunit M [Gammaproteobacteria bacterium]